MKTLNRETGRLAENLAATALIKKGYLILQTNFRTRYGEIDIIASDKDTFVFVEVKAKKGLDFGIPEEMINKRKLKKIRRLAEVYTNGQTVNCRIDIVALVLDNSNKLLRLTHYENVSYDHLI